MSQHIMIESPSFEEETITKDVRNLFRLEKLEKETIGTTIKSIRSLFRLEKENKARIVTDNWTVFKLGKESKPIKDKLLRDIRNLFKHQEEVNYYKPVTVSNFWSNNYIIHKSKGDRNKTLSVQEHLNKVRLYLKDIIYNLKKSDIWKIQLTMANNFISSIDNNKELVMHSKSDRNHDK